MADLEKAEPKLDAGDTGDADDVGDEEEVGGIGIDLIKGGGILVVS